MYDNLFVVVLWKDGRNRARDERVAKLQKLQRKAGCFALQSGGMSQGEKMKVTERARRIIGKELQWLPALIPNDAVEFFVQLIDVDTLGLRPKGKTLHDGEWRSYERILLIAGDGTVVGEVGKEIVPEHHVDLLFWWKTVAAREVSFSESVEEALRRIPGTANVRYILQIESEVFRYDSEKDSYPKVTLHKLPRKVPNLGEWLGQKAEEEETRLREKLEEADL